MVHGIITKKERLEPKISKVFPSSHPTLNDERLQCVLFQKFQLIKVWGQFLSKAILLSYPFCLCFSVFLAFLPLLLSVSMFWTYHHRLSFPLASRFWAIPTCLNTLNKYFLFLIILLLELFFIQAFQYKIFSYFWQNIITISFGILKNAFLPSFSFNITVCHAAFHWWVSTWPKEPIQWFYVLRSFKRF